MGLRVPCAIVLLFVAVLSGCGASMVERPPTPDEIEALERQMWDDFKNARYSAMGERMLADVVMVDQSGIADRASVVAGLEQAACKVDSYSLEDVRVMVLAPTVALISYRSVASGTCGAQSLSDSPPDLNTSVWVKQDGTWRTASHQGTPVTQ